MRKHIPWLHVAGGSITGLALILATMALLSQGSLAQRNCRGLELVKAQIRLTFRESQRVLGQPGSALYDYYVEHPGELAQARLFNTRALHAFRVRFC